MKFTYLIVDDEPMARKLIASHTAKIEGLELAGECGNAIEASNVLRARQVDLIFLDIQMPEIDGLQFIRTLKNPPAIIITTAYRDFAPEAFDLDAIDYLLKPISFERLLKAVNKFFERNSTLLTSSFAREDKETFIYLKANRKTHKVFLHQIIYMESLDDYVKVHLADQVLITRENISVLEQKLPSDLFIRVHRSFIVSTKAVSAISSDGVEVRGKLLPFGRALKQSALAGLRIPDK